MTPSQCCAEAKGIEVLGVWREVAFGMSDDDGLRQQLYATSGTLMFRPEGMAMR